MVNILLHQTMIVDKRFFILDFVSATPIADYYIVGGTVYQAPDLGSVINSRMVSNRKKGL